MQRSPPTSTPKPDLDNHQKLCFICHVSFGRPTRSTSNILVCCTCKNAAHSLCIYQNKANDNTIWKCSECKMSPTRPKKSFTELLSQANECGQKENPCLKDVIKLMKGMIESQVFIANKFDDFESFMKTTVVENRNLKASVNRLEGRVNDLEKHINKIEQEKLEHHFVITGIPVNEEHNATSITSQIGKILNVDLTAANIKQARYMKSKNAQNKYAPLLIEVNDIKTKHSILENLKTNGPILASQLNIKNSNKKIVIHEFLTTTNQTLLQEVRKLKSDFELQFVWFKHGSVWARQSTTSKIHRIDSLSDVTSLKNALYELGDNHSGHH